jgi:CheY-like chemotaxis protein
MGGGHPGQRTLSLPRGQRAINSRSFPNMKINAEAFPFALAIAARISARSFPRFPLIRTNRVPLSVPRPSEDFYLRQTNSAASAPQTAERRSIYVVDDAPCLTKLYARLLEATGYISRTFNDRAEALAALNADRKRPDLLITDYRGLSMTVDQFMHQCLVVHPALRILMASGYSQTDLRFSQAIPDRFIQKPFTAEVLLQEVRTALADQ